MAELIFGTRIVGQVTEVVNLGGFTVIVYKLPEYSRLCVLCTRYTLQWGGPRQFGI